MKIKLRGIVDEHSEHDVVAEAGDFYILGPARPLSWSLDTQLAVLKSAVDVVEEVTPTA